MGAATSRCELAGLDGSRPLSPVVVTPSLPEPLTQSRLCPGPKGLALELDLLLEEVQWTPQALMETYIFAVLAVNATELRRWHYFVIDEILKDQLIVHRLIMPIPSFD